jgi:hypothetical protein
MINLDLVEDAGIFRSRRAAARQLGLLILSYFSKILCHNDRAMHASHSKYVLNDVTIGLSFLFVLLQAVSSAGRVRPAISKSHQAGLVWSQPKTTVLQMSH